MKTTISLLVALVLAASLVACKKEQEVAAPAPAEQAQAPAEQAQAPAEQAQAPAEQAQAPAEQAQAPAEQK